MRISSGVRTVNRALPRMTTARGSGTGLLEASLIGCCMAGGAVVSAFGGCSVCGIACCCGACADIPNVEEAQDACAANGSNDVRTDFSFVFGPWEGYHRRLENEICNGIFDRATTAVGRTRTDRESRRFQVTQNGWWSRIGWCSRISECGSERAVASERSASPERMISNEDPGDFGSSCAASAVMRSRNA